GGMEKVSFSLVQEFKKNTNLNLISWGRSQKYLPVVLPYFLIKSIYLITTKKIDRIHLGDALLSPIGVLLSKTFNIPISVTVHGLDITYQLTPYQFLIPKCLAQLD